MSTVEKYLKPEVIRQISRLDLRAQFIVKGFLQYVASPEGQAAAADAAGSAPISESLTEQVNAAIDLIVVE